MLMPKKTLACRTCPLKSMLINQHVVSYTIEDMSNKRDHLHAKGHNEQLQRMKDAVTK